MNSEVKKLWIDALLSGEYEQGRGQLRKDNKFCCLGVLCDLYEKQTGEVVWRRKKEHYEERRGVKEIVEEFVAIDNRPEDPDDFRTGSLPRKVMCWASIEDSAGGFRDKSSGHHTLMGANDNGKTFEQIAELIKTHF